MTDLTPGSPEWTKRITASKVAAILGVSPYDSPRSVWHLMHGDVPAWEGNDTTRRGQYLEAGVLAWWQAQHPEFPIVNPQPSYTLGNWAAATPDAEASTGTQDDGTCTFALVDAKTTIKDDEWGQPGTDQVPTYYYAQALWAMHVSGIHDFRFAVLHSRLRFEEYRVTYDADMGTDLERRMQVFYDTLATDEPPPLDDTVATYDAVRKVHPEIDRGEAVELSADETALLVTEYDIYKTTEPRLRRAKSVVIDRMGRAQYATHNGVRIARRQPHGDDVRFIVLAKPSDLTDSKEPAA